MGKAGAVSLDQMRGTGLGVPWVRRGRGWGPSGEVRAGLGWTGVCQLGGFGWGLADMLEHS